MQPNQSPFTPSTLIILLAATLGMLPDSARAADWPQWRGPDRSNVSSETGLLKAWPIEGPPLLWTTTGLGTGIASVSVADGLVFTMGYRDESEFVYALHAATGEARWVTRVGPEVKESSLMRWLSQRTPTVDEDRVYTFTASGELVCMRSVDGKPLWKTSYPNEFLSPRPGWGFCDYPVVDGEKLVCWPVGPQATVVALNKRTGDLIWKTAVPNSGRAGYAAPVISEACGIRQYVALLEGGLFGIAASDGRLLWRHPREPIRTAASYTPIIGGDLVFSPNGYGGGLTILKLVRDGDRIQALEQFHERLNFHPFQDATAQFNGHVYAFQKAGLPVCFELETGKLSWGPVQTAVEGRAALTCADGQLYIRGANGLMLLVDATPAAYVERGSFQIPNREEASGVTSPVVAGGRLYLRDNDRLLCYGVAADALTGPRPEPLTVTLPRELFENEARLPEEARPRLGRDRSPDAIYVPTPNDIVERMLELASLKKEDLFYDLGSGDGRIVIAAATKYGCRAIGYEIDPQLVDQARGEAARSEAASRVRFEHEDIFTVDLSQADVITVFLPSPLMERLIPQFNKLKPGSRIVSHQFEMPGIQPDKVETVSSKEDGDSHKLLLWTVPLRKASDSRTGSDAPAPGG